MAIWKINFDVSCSDSNDHKQYNFSFPLFCFYLIDTRSILIYITLLERHVWRKHGEGIFEVSADKIRIFLSLCRLSLESNCISTYDSLWIIDCFVCKLGNEDSKSWWLLKTCLFNNKAQTKYNLWNDSINSSLRFYWVEIKFMKVFCACLDSENIERHDT